MPTGMPVAVLVRLAELRATLGGRQVVLVAGGSKLLLDPVFNSRSTGAVVVPSAGVNRSLRSRAPKRSNCRSTEAPITGLEVPVNSRVRESTPTIIRSSLLDTANSMGTTLGSDSSMR